jgi:hypothetical protein
MGGEDVVCRRTMLGPLSHTPLPDNIHACHHFAKNHMLAVQPGRKKNLMLEHANVIDWAGLAFHYKLHFKSVNKITDILYNSNAVQTVPIPVAPCTKPSFSS